MGSPADDFVEVVDAVSKGGRRASGPAAMEGHLEKAEKPKGSWCACFSTAPEPFHGRFCRLDLKDGAFSFAKSKEMFEQGVFKTIKMRDCKSIHVKKDTRNVFIIELKRVVIKQNRYPGHEYYKFRAASEAKCAEWVRRLQDAAFLTCYIYSVPSSGIFPEQHLGVPCRTAVCFSGGGARAHTASVGQLRALHKMGVLDEKFINYMSSVSGSAWSTAIFTFHDKSSATDQELLGVDAKTKLGDLTMKQLEKEPCPLIRPATTQMWDMAEKLFWSSSTHEWWESTVGKTYLEPFGLNDDKPFADHRMMPFIKDHPNSRMMDFYVSRPGRPFWVANAAILSPRWAHSNDTVPIQFTPMYSGAPFLHTITAGNKVKHGEATSIAIGGGMVDSYAFGGEEPDEEVSSLWKRASLGDKAKAVASVATDMVKGVMRKVEEAVSEANLHSIQELAKGASLHNLKKEEAAERKQQHKHKHKHLQDAKEVQVPFPEHPLSLRHAIGISSHGPAFTFRNHAFTAKLNPRSYYWAPPHLVGDDCEKVSNPLKPRAHEMDFADGGTLDNFGVLAMLQRKVPRIIAFVNSEVPVPLQRAGKKNGKRKSLVASLRFSVSKAGSRKSVPDVADADVLEDLGKESKAVTVEATADRDDGFLFEEDEVAADTAEHFVPTFDDWPNSTLLSYFGITTPKKSQEASWAVYDANQVFESSKAGDLLAQLQRKKLNGEPCVAVDSYTVVDNPLWGITGGWKVTVMWVYLEKARNFEMQLPEETRREIGLGSRGAFPRFPTYRTFGTRHGKWIDPSLSNEQANLLAMQCEWATLENKEAIRSFLKAEEDSADDVVERLQGMGVVG